MSKIIKHTSAPRPLSHVVETESGSRYMVSSTDTFDAGYETMVFIWDDEEDDVGSWLDCYAEHYKSESQMEKGHDRICSNLEKYLKEGAKKCSKQ